MSDERFYSEDTFEDKHSGNPEDAGQHDAGQDRTQEIQDQTKDTAQNTPHYSKGGYFYSTTNLNDSGNYSSYESAGSISSSSYENGSYNSYSSYEGASGTSYTGAAAGGTSYTGAAAGSSSHEKAESGSAATGNGRYYSYNRTGTDSGAPSGNNNNRGGDYRRRRSRRGGGRLAVVLAVILVFVIGASVGALASGRFSGASLQGGNSSAQSRNEAAVKETEKESEKKAESAGSSLQSGQTSGGGTISTVKEAMGQSSLVDTTVADVAEQVMPAIVSVYNKYTEESQFFGRTYTQEGESAGSGIIIEETADELLIVTNNHVVEGADSLSVQFIDETNCEASLKGTDASSDLAVIAVSLDSLTEGTKSNIAIAELGDSDSLRIGEHAIAIGNALGYGQSLTVGYISALNREITSEDGITGTFIQTDAAINPGNSGGALLNSKGQVIGINSNKIGGSAVEGMGFAIPISKAIPIIDGLKTQESRTKVAEEEQGVLGIYGISVTSDVASAYGLQVGAYIEEIIEGTGAADSDLQQGDIITAINGQTITGMEDLQNQLAYYTAGEEVTLTVQHPMEGGEYEEREIKLTLSKKSDVSSSSGDGRQGAGQRQQPSEEDDYGLFSFPFGF
ncbi:MAG: trypsin-like peptidase domain-containing protein [Lachnospiraceae bacterium]|nr:trypsin-like peptidase domain-containing protein [Lachnospiraceae bacterium]